MKMVLTAAVLSAALLLAALSAVQAKNSNPPQVETVTPTVVFGE